MKQEMPENKLELRGLASLVAAYEALLSKSAGILAHEASVSGEMVWLRTARESNAGLWQSKGLPTRRNERWKYTSLASVEGARVVVSSESSAHEQSAVLSGDFAAEIVLVNGRFSPALSKTSDTLGMRVTLLSDFLNERSHAGWTVKDHETLSAFKKSVEGSLSDENIFAAINTSFMRDAVLVEVKSGQSVPAPILIRHVNDSGSASETELPMACSRVFVNVAPNARIALVESYTGSDSSRSLVNALTDIRVARGARVDYCRVQTQAGGVISLGATRVWQERDSSFASAQFAFGGGISREELYIHLDGEGAEAQFDGFYFSKGHQHIDNYTLVEHRVPHTTSQQMYKGILDDEARAVFNGHVRIFRDAQKSNAAQVNKNLMLSRKAEVDTRPELEIDADDVKAAHGATIGQIDPEHVYYLQSRGISKSDAVKMLSHGFAQEIVFRMRNEKLRALMHTMVEEKLASLKGAHV